MSSDAERSLLCLYGTFPRKHLLDELIEDHTELIAADGTADRLLDLGVTPNIVIGDMDSLTGHDMSDLKKKGVTVIVDKDQEHGDFEKALNFLIERGDESVTIVGIDGGMLDHTLNNFSIVARYCTRIDMHFVNDTTYGFVLIGSTEMDDMLGARVSLIPLPAAVVTTSGLKWNLKREQLAVGIREGASNEAVEDDVRVEVHKGAIIVVLEV